MFNDTGNSPFDSEVERSVVRSKCFNGVLEQPKAEGVRAALVGCGRPDNSDDIQSGTQGSKVGKINDMIME